VSKKKLKTPRIAPMLQFNYQIKIPALNYNPKKKLVLAVKVFWVLFSIFYGILRFMVFEDCLGRVMVGGRYFYLIVIMKHWNNSWRF
jgi:hypothetical protein